MKKLLILSFLALFGAAVVRAEDKANYGWIIQFQYEITTPWHSKH